MLGNPRTCAVRATLLREPHATGSQSACLQRALAALSDAARHPWPLSVLPQITFVGRHPDPRTPGAIVKRTYQPNTRRRARKHGFRARMRTRAGRSIIKARRLKGRTRLSA